MSLDTGEGVLWMKKLVSMLGGRSMDMKGVVVIAAHARAYRIAVNIHSIIKEQDR